MKLSKYVNDVPFTGGVLVHNCLFNTALKIYEPKRIKQYEELKQQKFISCDESDKLLQTLRQLNIIVNDDVDEIAMANLMYDKRSIILQLFLIVTRQCNFRCPYCFQDHTGKVMEWKTYELAKKYFLSWIKREKHDDTCINFFGGEPLLEIKNIIRFMTELREECVNDFSNEPLIYGQITTNGYLLTPENLKKLVEVGVNRYQVTLDGLAKTHNKSRYLASGNGSWERIVKNLTAAKQTNLDFRIQLRTNYTQEILDQMGHYLAFVKKTFCDDKRFKLYFEAAKDYGTLKESDCLDVCLDEAATSQKLTKMIRESGISGSSIEAGGFTLPLGLMCYASSPTELVMDYDGSFRKCTFDLDNEVNLVGNCDEENSCLDVHQIAKWTSYDNPQYCKECSIYPVCYGKKCPMHYLSNEDMDKKKDQAHCDVQMALYRSTLEVKYLF